MIRHLILATFILCSCDVYQDPYGEPYKPYDDSFQELPKYPTVFIEDSGDYGDTLYWCHNLGTRVLCFELQQRQEEMLPQNSGDIDPVPCEFGECLTR